LQGPHGGLGWAKQCRVGRGRRELGYAHTGQRKGGARQAVLLVELGLLGEWEGKREVLGWAGG
jgi:hypothetical protein